MTAADIARQAITALAWAGQTRHRREVAAGTRPGDTMKYFDIIMRGAVLVACWACILVGVFTDDPWTFAVGATILALTHLREIESRL